MWHFFFFFSLHPHVQRHPAGKGSCYRCPAGRGVVAVTKCATFLMSPAGKITAQGTSQRGTSASGYVIIARRECPF